MDIATKEITPDMTSQHNIVGILYLGNKSLSVRILIQTAEKLDPRSNI